MSAAPSVRRVVAWALATALWGVAVPVSAQLPAAPVPAALDLGQQASGQVAEGGRTFHAYAGVGGTRLRATLVAPGARTGVAIYDTNGAEVAYADGDGGATVSYTLPEDGIYLVGITSAASAVRYTLSIDGQEPRIRYEYDEPGVASGAAGQLPAEAAPVPATPPPTAFVADPAVWGVYAQLAGRLTVPKPGVYQVAWVWVRPGEELAEEWRDGTGRVASRSLITPTGQPGQLLLRSQVLGDKEWLGRVGEGGRITLVGKGGFKLAYVVELIGDGLYQMRRARVDANGEPTSILAATPRNQWVLAPE